MLGFESFLEKDHFILLEYDDQVTSFEEQPVAIPLGGKTKPYVTDVVINYRQPKPARQPKPSLVEVKTTQDLEKNQAKYARKFSAAKKWAADRGWVFKTRSEKDIRCLRLDFLKFLREYHCIDPDAADIEPPRIWWRPNTLRGLSHDQIKQVFPRSPRACGAHVWVIKEF